MDFLASMAAVAGQVVVVRRRVLSDQRADVAGVKRHLQTGRGQKTTSTHNKKPSSVLSNR